MGKSWRGILQSPQINIKCYANQSGKVCILRKSFLVWRHNWPASEDWAEWWWDNDDKERQWEACDKCGLLRGAPVNGQPYHCLTQPATLVCSIWYLVFSICSTIPATWFLAYNFWCLVSAPPYQLGLTHPASLVVWHILCGNWNVVFGYCVCPTMPARVWLSLSRSQCILSVRDAVQKIYLESFTIKLYY